MSAIHDYDMGDFDRGLREMYGLDKEDNTFEGLRKMLETQLLGSDDKNENMDVYLGDFTDNPEDYRPIDDALEETFEEMLQAEQDEEAGERVTCRNCDTEFFYCNSQQQCPTCGLLHQDRAIDLGIGEIDEDGNERGIEYIRETFQWGSYGLDGTEPVTHRYLKDISDSHLVHIIGHLVTHNRAQTLIMMLEEARYRSENNIFVANYEE